MCGMVASKSDDKWRAESDKDTLMRAAEVVADRLRLKNAMKLMRTQREGVDTMLKVLSRRKAERG